MASVLAASVVGCTRTVQDERSEPRPSFVRLFHEKVVDPTQPEPYEQAGNVHRRAIVSARALASIPKFVDVSDAGAFPVSALITPDDVHPNTVTLEVAVLSEAGVQTFLVPVGKRTSEHQSPPNLGTVTVPRLVAAGTPAFHRLELLNNGGFEDLAHSLALLPWRFPGWDPASGDSPFAGETKQAPEGQFLLELHPRSNGDPVRLVQDIPVYNADPGNGRYEASVQGYSTAANALDLLVTQEIQNKQVVLARATHPGDGRWHTLKLSIDYARIDRAAPLAFEIRRRADANGTIKVDDAHFALINARCVRACVRQLTRFETAPLTIPEASKLEIGYALFGGDTSNVQNPVDFHVSAIGRDGEHPLFSSRVSEQVGPDGANGSWHPTTIDLAPLAGQTCRLSFDTSVQAIDNPVPGTLDDFAADFGAAATWAQPILVANRPEAEPASGQKPNIIVISLDTLRADRLGCYGYTRGTTPAIDRFAKDSILFEDCYSTTSWTTPAHASLFTGLLPSIHLAGIPGGGSQKRNRLGSGFVTLAEMASNEGYLTSAFTEGYFCGGRWGLQQGFDVYSNGPNEEPSPGTIERTFQHAKEWLQAHESNPFFMFVHTYEIHWPYDPPQSYRDTFAPTASEGVEMPGPEQYLTGEATPAQRQLASDLYDAGVAYADAVVGDFFNWLKASGLYDNCIVLLVSDHGEEFWEHGYVTHGFTVYNEVLHVPFILKLPRNESSGRRYPHPSSLADAYPTILDLMGVKPPNQGISRDLVPALAGPSPTNLANRAIPSELFQVRYKELFYAMQTADKKCILTSPFDAVRTLVPEFSTSDYTVGLATDILKRAHATPESLTAAPDSDALRAELYLLQTDPREQSNQAESSPEVVQQMLETIRKLYERSAADANAAPESAAPLSEEEQEGLRALGYL